MHMLTASISQMVTDREKIAIANKFEVAHGLAIGMLTYDIGPF